jgi:hypothetical protein
MTPKLRTSFVPRRSLRADDGTSACTVKPSGSGNALIAAMAQGASAPLSHGPYAARPREGRRSQARMLSWHLKSSLLSTASFFTYGRGCQTCRPGAATHAWQRDRDRPICRGSLVASPAVGADERVRCNTRRTGTVPFEKSPSSFEGRGGVRSRSSAVVCSQNSHCYTARASATATSNCGSK